MLYKKIIFRCGDSKSIVENRELKPNQNIPIEDTICFEEEVKILVSCTNDRVVMAISNNADDQPRGIIEIRKTNPEENVLQVSKDFLSTYEKRIAVASIDYTLDGGDIA